MELLLTVDRAEQILEENGLHSKGDNCFIGIYTPSIWLTALLGNLWYSLNVKNIVINERENDIVIVPCNQLTNDLMIDKRILIPKSEITKVEVSNGSNFGVHRIIAYKDKEKAFQVDVSAAIQGRYKEMVKNFVMSFENTEIELLDKKSSAVASILLAVVFIAFLVFVGIFMILDGELMGILVLGVGLIMVALCAKGLLMKRKSDKENNNPIKRN